jgi:hypothetical protein
MLDLVWRASTEMPGTASRMTGITDCFTLCTKSSKGDAHPSMGSQLNRNPNK